MEFTITCPIDGVIEVGLEDVDSVVVRESERADITFVCPHCGTAITVTAIVPSFLISAIEALAEDPEMAASTGLVVVTDSEDLPVGVDFSAVNEDPRAEAYCEYFRRQLNGVECVEDALAEIDSLELDSAT